MLTNFPLSTLELTETPYQVQSPCLLRLVKADNLPITDQILKVRKLIYQEIRLRFDLLKELRPRMIVLSHYHTLDIIDHKALVRGAKK